MEHIWTALSLVAVMAAVGAMFQPWAQQACATYHKARIDGCTQQGALRAVWRGM